MELLESTIFCDLKTVSWLELSSFGGTLLAPPRLEPNPNQSRTIKEENARDGLGRLFLSSFRGLRNYCSKIDIQITTK